MEPMHPVPASPLSAGRDSLIPDLLEREQQLAVLRDHLALAAAGNGRVVLVGGEAGIGKTALITEFCRTSCEPGQVLRTSCDALSTPGPLGPVRDLGPALGIDVGIHDGDADARDVLYHSVLAAFAARRQVTVVVGEDAHWADGATLELMRFLARRIDRVPLLIVVTYRNDELNPHHPLRRLLGDLATAPTVARMSLPPLSLAAVRDMASDHQRDPRHLHQLTGGNPFFLREVLATGTERVPPTIGDAVLARVARLSPEARAVLDTAAVIGTGADLDLLITVAGPVYDEIDACVDGGLFSTDDRAIFRHALVREAVLAAISPARRRLLHGRVLAALRDRPDRESNLALLAHHAEAAVDHAAVETFGIAAAKQARALHAHREAADQYARVLRCCPWLEDQQRAELLDARSEACYLNDQIEDAIAARLEALAIWRRLGDRVAEGRALRWLSRLHWFNGDGEAAHRMGEAALAVLEAMPPGPELAMAYSNLSQLRMLANDHQAAIHWGSLAIALCEELNSRETLVHALNNVGAALAELDPESGQGDQELERSLQLALAEGFVDHAARANVNLTWSALKRMALGLAAERLDRAITYAAEHDLTAYHAYLHATRGMLRYYQGDWDAALADCRSALRRPEISPVIRIMALTPIGLIQARRGDPAASVTLDEVLGLATVTGELQRVGPPVLARAEAALLDGDRERAATELRRITELVRQRGNPWQRGAVAWMLWQAGDQRKVAGEVALPYRHLLAGEWRAAAAAWEEVGCPYEAALARLASDDSALVRHALETFERLEAKPAIRQARERLRALGVRDVPAARRGPLASTREHPAGLTRREAEVLELLRSGLSRAEIANQLYLTPKTVSHHLSAVYAKLGVANRAEAISLAAETGVPRSEPDVHAQPGCR